MRTWTVDLDGPVDVADFGGSGDPMVLVHGLGGSHVDWIDVAPRLAERARVLAPDLIGHGGTPLQGRSASVGSNVEMLTRFIAEVAGGPAVLVGNSMGGLIAIMQAAAQPEHVAGLIAVDPAVPPAPGLPVDPVTEQIFTAYDTPGVGENLLRVLVDAIGIEAVFQEFMAFICAEPSRLSPGMIEAQLAMQRTRVDQPWADQAFLEAARSLLHVVWHDPAEFQRALLAVRAPTLVIHGSLDRLVLVSAIDEVARARPDWTVCTLDGVGHVPMMESPDGFMDLVGSWLDRTDLLPILAG